MFHTSRWFAPVASISRQASALLALACLFSQTGLVSSQEVLPLGSDKLPKITAQAVQKEEALVESILDPELVFHVNPTRSRIMRTKLPVDRIAFTDPEIVDVNEFGPNEIEIIGLKAGETTLTIWFRDLAGKESIIRYLVRVGADETEQEQANIEFGKLQTRVNELFPNSFIQLIPVADKVIVRGQARDSKEAAEILAVIGGQSVDQNGQLTTGFVNVGTTARVGGLNSQASNLINLLEVPGEQQVMLKVRIAELTRNARRELGMDFEVLGDSFEISNFLPGGGGNIGAILSSGDVELFIKAFATNGYSKMLAEPTLVTTSGQPATFISGGEFAVPTAVGIDGIGAVSTTFQGFGTQLTFTPTVFDKDMIRLQVAPSVSEVNAGNAVDGIPGLDIRAATTTVNLREGQWLAIAGLIQDEQQGRKNRLPFLGDIPVIGAAFENHRVNRDETELVILVSPELVHPLEAEQVPLFLPGMDVTEPDCREFWWHQQIEGNPNKPYRSTVWPAYRHQLHHHGRDCADCYSDRFSPAYQKQQDYYISGSHGFTK